MGRKKSKSVEAGSDTSSSDPNAIGGGMAGDDGAGGSGSAKTGTGRRRGPGRRQNGNSIQGYFRAILADRPDLVAMRSNEAIFEKWLADHPGHTEVPQQVKNGLSNVKSALRNKVRSGKKKRGRPRKSAVSTEPFAAATSTPVAARAPVVSKLTRSDALESLEEQIDECLSVAKRLDKEDLEKVIVFLRRARNAVVLIMGE
jgi:hypothetical protein